MESLQSELELKTPFFSSRTKRYLFVLTTFMILCILMYGKGLQTDWIFDDYDNIINNSNIHATRFAWDELGKSFHGMKSTGWSRPIAHFTFALNYYFGGDDVIGYRIVNIIILYLTGIMLFLLTLITLQLSIFQGRYEKCAYDIALLSSVLWMTSPVQVTAITYVVQRMASMAGLFFISSMYFYVKGRTARLRIQKIFFFCLCFFCGVLSLGSKENAAMLPVAILVYDFLFMGMIDREKLKRYLYLAIFVIGVVITLVLLYGGFSLDSLVGRFDIRPFSMKERLLTEPRVLLLYISLLLYPVSSRLMLLHDIEISRFLFYPWTTSVSIIAIIAFTIFAIYQARKRPLLSFAILFFFLNHAIEGSFSSLELIFEHRNYLPSMFFFLPIAVFMHRALMFFSYKPLLKTLVALTVTCIITAQGHTSFYRNFLLDDPFQLWSDNAKKAPNLSIVHTSLGNQYWKKGNSKEAISEYEKAIRLNRYMNTFQTGLAYHNAGVYCQIKLRDYDKAFMYYRQAMKTSSTIYPVLWSSLADVELKRAHTADAVRIIEKALRIWPEDHALAQTHVQILLETGNLVEAGQKGAAILRKYPHDSRTTGLLAEIYRRQHRDSLSVVQWQRFREDNPEDPRPLFALIELYSRLNRQDPLKTTVGQVSVMKGGKSIREMMEEIGKRDDDLGYRPDPAVLIPIIRRTWAAQN